MSLRFGLCALALVMFGTEAVAQEKNLLDALVAEETKLIEAIQKKDKKLIAEMLANEGLSITSRGKQSTAEIIKSLEKISFTSYKINNPRVIFLPPNVAILTYTFSWSGGEAGQEPVKANVYATSVWTNRSGKWRSAFYQETPMVLPHRESAD